jgi:hypothetical protein
MPARATASISRQIDGSITMTTQLFIYNEALGLLGERRLATSSENREPRRVLDSYWPDVTGYCLGQGLWRFAKRAVQIDNDASLTPQWGFNCCFLIPSDWVRTIVISTSPNLDPPLLQYNEEAGYWYANLTPIYAAYVSDDPTYGMNLGAWPEHFVDYVALRLARKCCFRITGSNGREAELKKDEDRARRVAKAEQAMNDPPGLPPVPFWARARRGAFGPGGLWLGGGAGGSVVTGPQGDD